jgi:hypothetical protein
VSKLDRLDRDLLDALVELWHASIPWYTTEPIAWRALAREGLVCVIRNDYGDFVMPSARAVRRRSHP